MKLSLLLELVDDYSLFAVITHPVACQGIEEEVTHVWFVLESGLDVVLRSFDSLPGRITAEAVVVHVVQRHFETVQNLLDVRGVSLGFWIEVL